MFMEVQLRMALTAAGLFNMYLSNTESHFRVPFLRCGTTENQLAVYKLETSSFLTRQVLAFLTQAFTLEITNLSMQARQLV